MLVFALSAIETVLVVFSMSLIAAATATRITFGMLLVVTPLTLVLHRLPITYWGIGVVEGGFAFLLKALYRGAPDPGDHGGRGLPGRRTARRFPGRCSGGISAGSRSEPVSRSTAMRNSNLASP